MKCPTRLKKILSNNALDDQKNAPDHPLFSTLTSFVDVLVFSSYLFVLYSGFDVLGLLGKLVKVSIT
jgi:hypothetical protein